MRRRQRFPDPDDPWRVLGLNPGAGTVEIQDARRRLAKQAHPDVGGSDEAMQRVNRAADAALRSIEPSRSHRRSSSNAPGREEDRWRAGAPTRRDHPSFTVEALPVETFEALLVVASWLGDVITDEPPYELEVALSAPIRGWCRLDLVPDAGASTISLSVAAEPGYPVPDVDAVRDAWVEGLNRLDWADLRDGSLDSPRPS